MGPWSPAGPNWQQAIRTDLVSAITAAEMQCDDPDKVATRWSEIVEIDRADVDGVPTIPLENATLRFVPITDGRGEGLGGIDLACSDPDAVQGQRRASAACRSPTTTSCSSGCAATCVAPRQLGVDARRRRERHQHHARRRAARTPCATIHTSRYGADRVGRRAGVLQGDGDGDADRRVASWKIVLRAAPAIE